MRTQPISGNRPLLAISGFVLAAAIVSGCAPTPIPVASSPEVSTPTPTPAVAAQSTFSMAEINVRALKTALTNASAAVAHPTESATIAEAVNTVVSLASETLKPKLTTEEWTNIAVPNYKLQIDSGNGKGLEVILPAAQDIIVKIERSAKNIGVL